MIYAFILGRNFILSIAELFSVFERERIKYEIIALSSEVLIVKMAEEIKNEQEFLNSLGGTLKIINIYGEEHKIQDFKKTLSADNLLNHYPNIKTEIDNIPSVKLYWGVSVYFICNAASDKKYKTVKQIHGYLFGTKEALRERNIKCRIVTPPNNKFTLDAPSVDKNNLLKKGGEIVFIVNKEKTYWGKTLAIQDYQSYGLRDYGRPARSMKVGMMPPKLAQIMINLSQAPKNGIILDPFSGTGVVLQEAILMGYKVIGTDNDSETISLAKKNMEWLSDFIAHKFPQKSMSKDTYKLFRANATELSKTLPINSISAIISEGTLGPKYGRIVPSDKQIDDNYKNLEKLYIEAFKQFKTLLKDGSPVVISFPVYLRKNMQTEFTPFLDKIVQLGYNIKYPIKADELRNVPLFTLSKNGTIIYSRPDQNVGREIVVFIKNKTNQ